MVRAAMQPDRPGAEAERIAHRKAAALAVQAREERYPVLTTENAREALAFQDAELARLLAEVCS